MMKYPEYAQVGDKLYKINTDFKVAIECQDVAQKEISGEEKALAIIYLLFGDEGLDNPQDYEVLLDKALLYLSCGKEQDDNTDEPDMDYIQDEPYIKASFYTDYGIPNIYDTNMHWWEFVDLLNGLKDDCVLNRVREIRNYDLSQVKDPKIISLIMKQKQLFSLKRKEPEITEEQARNYEYFMEQISKKR